MFCNQCGANIPVSSDFCIHCGEKINEQYRPVEDTPSDPVNSIIPYKNSSALIAYYLGVFSLIPCLGLLLGIPAAVLGSQGLKFSRAHPEAKGRTHAWVGLILGGLCVLLNVVAILIMVLAPSF